MMAVLLGPMGWAGVPILWGFMGFTFWALLIALIVLGARWMRTTAPASGGAAVRLLEERYARGEISRKDFLERQAVLRGSSPG
jgi:uncharacterized membrane protein